MKDDTGQLRSEVGRKERDAIESRPEHYEYVRRETGSAAELYGAARGTRGPQRRYITTNMLQLTMANLLNTSILPSGRTKAKIYISLRFH